MKVILFVNVRDEHNICEWVCHHLMIGFDGIIIFDHKSKQPIKAKVESISRKVRVFNACRINNDVKMTLMNYAVTLAKQMKFDWMIYIDADEFIILNKHNDVQSLLREFNNCDSVALNWLMFGTNHLVKDNDEQLILEKYTRCQSTLDKHIKTFVRPNAVKHCNNPHFYVINDKSKYYSVNRQRVLLPYFWHTPINTNYSNTPAYVAHYVHQSEETYRKRKGLPRDDDNTKRELKSSSELHSLYNDVVNTFPRDKYAENVKTKLESLKSVDKYN